MAAVRGDIRTTPSSPPARSKERTLLGKPRRRNRPVKHGLPEREALGLQRRLHIEGDRLAGKMHERASLWVERAGDQTRQFFASAGTRGHFGEAELGRGLRGCFADGKERKPQRRCKIGVGGKRAERIAARDDQGLRTVKVEGCFCCRLDKKERRDHGLVSPRGEDLGLARRIRFRPGNEEAHQERGVRLERKFGPASASSSRPAPAPMLAASSGRPSRSISCHSVPSGFSTSPRKRKAPSAISARPAIGVRQDPSSSPGRRARRRRRWRCRRYSAPAADRAL